jgi:hypothetical protein
MWLVMRMEFHVVDPLQSSSAARMSLCGSSIGGDAKRLQVRQKEIH